MRRAAPSRNRRRTVHVLSNAVVRTATPGKIVITALVQLRERSDDGGYPLVKVLETTQTFRLEGGRWRIAARRTEPLHR